MNDQNSLENQLRSWTPRRPSAKLKDEIFAEPLSVSAGDCAHALFFRFESASLAALAICLLLMTFLWQSPRFWSVQMTGSLPYTSYSNQNCAAYLSFASAAHNVFSAPIFGWTNL